MITYCPTCAQKNEWSGVKPTTCEFCKNPFVRKAIAARPTRLRSEINESQHTVSRRSDDMEDEEIPTSFDMETNARPRRGKKATFETIESVRALGADGEIFQRESVSSELSAIKQEALKHMLPGGNK